MWGCKIKVLRRHLTMHRWASKNRFFLNPEQIPLIAGFYSYLHHYSWTHVATKGSRLIRLLSRVKLSQPFKTFWSCIVWHQWFAAFWMSSGSCKISFHLPSGHCLSAVSCPLLFADLLGRKERWQLPLQCTSAWSRTLSRTNQVLLVLVSTPAICKELLIS